MMCYCYYHWGVWEQYSSQRARYKRCYKGRNDDVVLVLTYPRQKQRSRHGQLIWIMLILKAVSEQIMNSKWKTERPRDQNEFQYQHPASALGSTELTLTSVSSLQATPKKLMPKSVPPPPTLQWSTVDWRVIFYLSQCTLLLTTHLTVNQST